MKNYGEKGFSIVEVMIAVSILSIVLAGLYNLFNSQVRSFEAQRDVSITQRDIRASLSLLERDIRMAGMGVPRGTNPVAAVLNGAGTDPDSISVNFSIGPLTYLTSSTVISPGIDNDIQVNNIAGFTIGDTINIVNNSTNNLLGSYTIDGIDIGNSRLSLNNDPTAAGIDVGDYVIKNFKTITYSVVTTGTPARMKLIRSDGTIQSTIIDGVANFQLSYILDDGSETASPGDLSDIRRVRIDLTAETVKEVAQLGSQQISRELVTIVPIKNVRL